MWPADLNDPAASSVELGVLVAYIDEIVHAVDAREREQIPLLLAEPIATHLPREIREELTLFAGQQTNSFRAPIRFLRYRYRIQQLAAAEGLEPQSQLDLGLGRGSGWQGIADHGAAGEESVLEDQAGS